MLIASCFFNTRIDEMKRQLVFLFLSLIIFPIYSQVKIEMERFNGIYQVPCEVNGLKMKFIFDTGATFVSISQSMADYMIENGYLSEKDYRGILNMYLADGRSQKAYTINLETIKISGFLLKNITAVISPSQNAPLLLGQSAIQKLGKVSIKDNFLIIENKIVEYTGIEEDIAFLGLKYGTSYNECEEVLMDKYGENNVLHSSLNGNTIVLEVEKEIFINKKFDFISLYFDEGSLVSTEATKFFPKKDLSKALSFRDNIFSYLNKKYKATKKIKTGKAFDSYVLGYKNKKDIDAYPIKIEITKCNMVLRKIEDETDMLEGYEVSLKYWPAALNKIINDHVVQDEY